MRIYTYFKYTLSVLVVCLFATTAFAQSYVFERVFDETLSQASYFIGDKQSKEAIVIDAKRDIDTYLELGRKYGMTITKVTETHIHADFLSGTRELAVATGAEMYLSDEGGADWQYEFAHVGLRDRDQIQVGQTTLRVMHTPGHTPESLTFLLMDGISNPIKAITGDFIFVGDVGRPDLLEKAAGQIGSQEVGARQLYHSIEKFRALADHTEIWPGHGAGSFCGRTLSHIPHSTLGEEKQNNPALQFSGREQAFVDYILADQLLIPKYFAVMKRLNKVDRPLRIQVPKLPKLDKQELAHAVANGLTIVDTRPKLTAAKGFISDSYLIENVKTFSTFAGSILDYQNQIILIAEDDKIDDLTRKLMRIGVDNIYGYVNDVTGQDVPLQVAKNIDISDFKEYLAQPDIQKIDVRTEAEYRNGHIRGVENIVLNDLENNLDKIDRDKPVVIHCQSGTRAAIAYSLLRKHGFDNILNYSGGVNDWVKKESPLVK